MGTPGIKGIKLSEPEQRMLVSIMEESGGPKIYYGRKLGVNQNTWNAYVTGRNPWSKKVLSGLWGLLGGEDERLSFLGIDYDLEPFTLQDVRPRPIPSSPLDIRYGVAITFIQHFYTTQGYEVNVSQIIGSYDLLFFAANDADKLGIVKDLEGLVEQSSSYLLARPDPSRNSDAS